MTSKVLITWCLLILVGLSQVVVADPSTPSGSESFTTSDGDSDGFLTPDELVAAISKLGLRTPETNAERDSLVARMDFNQDGKVDKTEFTTSIAKGDSFVGQLGILCTRFLDNVGILNLVNQFGAACGIMPGNELLDITAALLLSLIHLSLVLIASYVSYFKPYAFYWLSFCATMYMWLVVFTAIDVSTEYPAGFTVMSFIGALVGTADFVMEYGTVKKDAASGRRNAAKLAKARLGKR